MAKKIKFRCDKCGLVRKASFDGYEFGERVLEGVMFDAVLDDKGKLTVSVQPIHKEYFSTLNQKKWLAEARDYVYEADVLNCGSCSQECMVQVEGRNPSPPPIRIGMGNIDSLIDQRKKADPRLAGVVFIKGAVLGSKVMEHLGIDPNSPGCDTPKEGKKKK